MSRSPTTWLLVAAALLAPRASLAAGTAPGVARTGSASGAPVPTVELQVHCPARRGKAPVDEFGSGVIVRDWRGGSRSILLTALHVVHDCDWVRAFVVDCNGKDSTRLPVLELAEGREVLLWPGQDLAAIPLDDKEASKVLAAGRWTGVAEMGFEQAQPERLTELRIFGTSRLNPCTLASGKLTGYLTAGFLTEFLSRRAGKGDGAPLLGTIAPTTVLVLYDLAAAPGSSGAPVAAPSSSSVLALHDGGNAQIKWGVLLVGARLSEPQIAHLGVSFPAFRAMTLDQADPSVFLDLPAQERRWSLSIALEGSFDRNTLGAAPTVAYANELTISDDLSRAFGFRLAVSIPVVRQLRSFVAPNNVVVEQDHVNRVGPRFEGALQGRLYRLSSVRLGLDLGLRFGANGYYSPNEKVQLVGTVGGVARARIGFSVPGLKSAVAIEAAVAVDSGLSVRYRYTGIGGAFDEAAAALLPSWSGGLSYEF